MQRLRIATVPMFLILTACVHERSGSPAAPADPVAMPATAAPSPVIGNPASAVQPQPAPSAPLSEAAASAAAAEPSAVQADAQTAALPAPPRTTSQAPSIRSGSTADKVSPSSPATTSRALPVPPTASASKPVSPATVAALDLNALEQRLRDTHAIGVFTKLSLKNQVDDLLAQFKTFYQGQSQITLPQLRQKYEVLLLKVVSVLQDKDPSLASAVSSSREAIWGILTDPKKFANM